ncbi:MAG TPA: carboxypeptidase regulatory-like domain-containing protein [Bryobacteraceae bacterium]|nr:carboxypeptidase regulatory-like domain-containing protein [Bryobacteraceae bacterium]
MSKRKSHWFGALCLVALLSFSAFAQSDVASISGFVRDASGAVVPGAKVVIKNEGVEFERTLTTNNEGYYYVAALPPGLYTVTAEHAGFQSFELLHKKLDPSIPATVDIVLAVGQSTQSVTVTAATAAVQTESATVGELVEHQTVDLTELDGRNPALLAQLMPGVIANNLAGNSFGMTTGNFNVNGSQTYNTQTYFDGAVGIRTRANSSRSIGVADLDSTQEVQVLTSNFSAEYGRESGGEVRIISKSGTNQFHGDLYEYFRNARLEADTWSRNDTGYTAPSPLRYNQFGGYIGGPILIPGTRFNKSRTHMFFTFGEEALRQRTDTLDTAQVPDALMRTGNFSEFLAPSIYYNTAHILTDPNGNPYPGNIIPSSVLSPNGMALINALPNPTPGFLNSSNQNFFIDYPSTPTNQRKDTYGGDWNINEKMQFRFRGQVYSDHVVSWSDTYVDQPQNNPNKRGSIDYVYTISPTWVNEVLLSASGDHVTTSIESGVQGSFDRSRFGIDYPYLLPVGKDDPNKIPSTGYQNSSNWLTLNGTPYPSHSAGPVWVASDNLTHVYKNHTFKMGYYYEKSGENDDDQIVIGSTPGGTNNQDGLFTFANSTPGGTGLDFANEAIGKFYTYAEVGQRSFTPYRTYSNEFYGQDSWKVTSKLHLDIGARWNIVSPYYSLWGNIAYFDPAAYNPANAVQISPVTGDLVGTPTIAQQYNGMVIPGTGWPSAAAGRVGAENAGIYNSLFNGGSNKYTEWHYKDIAPRFGLAYAFTPKTVFRGGFGRFYDHVGVSDGNFPGGTAPLQIQESVSNGNVDNPGGTSITEFPTYAFSSDQKNPTPYSMQWNATVQRDIGFNTLLTVAYVGKRGVHLTEERNLNQLNVGTCPLAVCPTLNGVAENEDYLVPFKGYSQIIENVDLAESLFNSMQVQITHRFTNGLNFNFSYTLSKSLDNASGYEGVLPNAWDNSYMWGPSTFDHRNVFVGTAVYALPIFKTGNGMAHKLLGGWSLDGVYTYTSGSDFSIGTGTDYAGVGVGGGTQYWVQNGPIQYTDQYSQGGTAADPNFFFKPTNASGTAEFTPPPAGTINSQRVRDAYYGPAYWDINSALFKDFRVNERMKFTLRWEQYNTLNHPNWSGPNTTPTSAAFGKITSKSGNRDQQIALKFIF